MSQLGLLTLLGRMAPPPGGSRPVPEQAGGPFWAPLADGFDFVAAAPRPGGAGRGAGGRIDEGVHEGTWEPRAVVASKGRPPVGASAHDEAPAAAPPEGPPLPGPSSRPGPARDGEPPTLLGVLGDAPLESYTSGRGGLGAESGFNIELVFEGAWTADIQDEFILAAEYLSAIVTGDLKGDRGVDDLQVTVDLSGIDGLGGFLGQAGPTALRPGSQAGPQAGLRTAGALPSKGLVAFDASDVAAAAAGGTLGDVALHEMLHVLGFGTLWDLLGLSKGSVAADTIRFTGPNARAAYRKVFPEAYAEDVASNGRAARRGVPVEADHGPGTEGGHWDEETFGDELMTGIMGEGAAVSALTVAALEDMGYETVFERRKPGADLIQPDDLLV